MENDLCRIDGEIDAGELWKFRDPKFTGRIHPFLIIDPHMPWYSMSIIWEAHRQDPRT